MHEDMNGTGRFDPAQTDGQVTSGGVLADRLAGDWLAQNTMDTTANRVHTVPEELLHYRPEAELAAGAVAMAGEVVQG